MQGSLQRMSAHPVKLDLERFCHEIFDEIRISIGQKHEFVFNTDGQLQMALGDKALIRRIVINLLSNAVKYSSENTSITLTLARENNNAVIRVSDQGLGISPEEQKHIFEAFYRSNRVLNIISGTGLGLSIVKDCVDLHGGTITVESQPGQGTTFTVSLPQKLLSMPASAD
jgi:signal transduction histidine kinase